MKITVDAHVHLENFPANNVPVYARIYSSNEWTNGDDESVGAGSPSSQNYVKQVSCSYASGVTTISAFSGSNRIDSTTYGTSIAVASYTTYTLSLHNAKGGLITTVYTGMIVPATPTTTTFPDIVLYSSAPQQPFRSAYYTREQVDALLDDLDLAPDATTVIKGKVLMDTVAAVLTSPTVVGINSARINRVLSEDYGNSLVTALASIGGTDVNLIIKVDTNVSSSLTVPDNVLLVQEDNALIIESGTGTIAFQGQGIADPLAIVPFFQGFEAGDITWTGTVYPKEISSAIMADTNLNAKMRILTAAFVNKSVTFIQYPAPTTDSVTMNDGHSIYRMPGSYLNTLATRGTTNLPAYTMGSNSSFSSAPGALSYDSSSGTTGNTYMVYTAIEAENVVIENNHFIGGGGAHDGAVATCLIQNGDNCHIRNNFFDGAQAYHAGIANVGSGNDIPRNCSITGNLHRGYMSQLVFITAGYGCAIQDNVIDLANMTGLTYFTPIDIEPNENAARIDNLIVSGNRIDVRGVNQYCTGIAIQGTSTPNLTNITCRDNIIIGLDISTAVDYGYLQVGIDAYGISNLQLSNNTVQGCYDLPIRTRLCRYGFIADNEVIQCGNGFSLIATASTNVCNNLIAETTPGIAQLSTIVETEQEYTVTTSGFVATSSIALVSASLRFYDFFVGLSVVINATTYVVASVDTTAAFQTVTMTGSIGTLPVMSVASATDVDTATDTITFGAHNYQNGARLRYTAGAGAIGGLTTGTTYFVVGRTATTVQLALTLGGAVIDLTTTGTGTQTFTAVLLTQFSSNLYNNNLAADGITLVSSGTSRWVTDFSRTQYDSYAPSQITSNQNNYAPASNAYRLDLSTDASRNITGLTYAILFNGDTREIYNAGSFNIVLQHNVTSTAANRFWTNTLADITLLPGQRATLEYNSTIARWMVAAYDVIITAASLPTGIDAAKIADGSVSNAEFQYLNGVSSAIQTQMDLKAPLISPSFTTPAIGVATGTSLAATGLIKSSSPTTGIGYATGAGGAVTQATDKSTTVVSNTITTAITMNNAALNLDTAVSFTFTNSAIAATDTVLVTHESAGTSGSYVCNAFPGSGSAVITVRNVTGGSLSEAIVLRVTVIKSVSS